MKFKGEKELTAEELYNSLDSELYDILVVNGVNIDKLDVTHEDEYVTGIIKESLHIQISYKVVEVIYNMDLEINESKVLLKLSNNNKLVNNLVNIVENNIEEVNIYNKKELEKLIKTIIAGLILSEQLGNGDYKENDSTSTL